MKRRDTRRVEALRRHRPVIEQVREAGLDETDPKVARYLRGIIRHPERPRSKRMADKLTEMAQVQILNRAVLGDDWTPLPPPEEHALPLAPQVLTGHMVSYDVRDLTKPTLVAGKSGIGKDNTTQIVVERLVERGLDIDIVEIKGGEYTPYVEKFSRVPVLSPADDPVNLFDPVGPWRPFMQATMADHFHYYGLGSMTRTNTGRFIGQIYDGLGDLDPPSPYELERVACIEGREDKSRRRPRNESLFTFARALASLKPDLHRRYLLRKGPDLDSDHPMVVYQWTGLSPALVNLLLANRFLRWSSRQRLNGYPNRPVRMSVWGETLSVFGKGVNENRGNWVQPGSRLITSARVTGYCFWGCTQSLVRLDPTFLGQVHLFICFNLPNPDDAYLAARMLAFEHLTEGARQIMSLRLGESFIKVPDWPKAVRVQWPPSEFPGYVSEERIQQGNEGLLQEIHSQCNYARPERSGEGINYRDILEEHDAREVQVTKQAAQAKKDRIGDELMGFLLEISEHPEAGVMERCKNLGIPTSRENRIKKSLEEQGFIEISKRKPESGRGAAKQIIRLSDQGRRFLNS